MHAPNAPPPFLYLVGFEPKALKIGMMEAVQQDLLVLVVAPRHQCLLNLLLPLILVQLATVT